MHVTVRLFARLRELTGSAELRRQVADDATAMDAWNALTRDFPDLAAYTRTVSCAVNESYARFTTRLKDGDEVAFLPPVSGGVGRKAGSGMRDAGSGMRDADWRFGIRDAG